jgi:hypothetical protein
MSHISVDREVRSATASAWRLLKKDLEFQNGIKVQLFISLSRTEVTIPTELSGMPHVSVLIMLIL